MKCLLVIVVLSAYNYVIWGQNLILPSDEGAPPLSNGTVTIKPTPVLNCSENMIPYPGDSIMSIWLCDCRSRFLYFPTNDSCHEAYRQGPCPLHHFVVLPEGEQVPQCEGNPCFIDGMVPYNGACHFLGLPGGPCGLNTKLDVNETTFQLDCMSSDVVPFHIIDTAAQSNKMCPLGSRRSTLGECKKIPSG